MSKKGYYRTKFPILVYSQIESGLEPNKVFVLTSQKSHFHLYFRSRSRDRRNRSCSRSRDRSYRSRDRERRRSRSRSRSRHRSRSRNRSGDKSSKSQSGWVDKVDNEKYAYLHTYISTVKIFIPLHIHSEIINLFIPRNYRSKIKSVWRSVQPIAFKSRSENSCTAQVWQNFQMVHGFIQAVLQFNSYAYVCYWSK